MQLWNKLPRWVRDTLSVVAAMSFLLVLYDWLLAKHVNWALVPLQIIVALIAVGAWSYLSYRSQAKRKLADQKKADDAKKRAAAKAKREAVGAQQAAETRERNVSRNQQHQQHRHQD